MSKRWMGEVRPAVAAPGQEVGRLGDSRSNATAARRLCAGFGVPNNLDREYTDDGKAREGVSWRGERRSGQKGDDRKRQVSLPIGSRYGNISTGPEIREVEQAMKRDNKNRLWASGLWLGTVLIAWRCFIPYAIGQTSEYAIPGVLLLCVWWAGMILVREKIDWFDKD